MLLASSPRKFQSRDEIWRELRQSSLLACDTETVSDEDTELLCISLAVSPDTSFAFSPDDEDIGKVWELLSKVPSLWHNIMFDVFNLNATGHEINWLDDTMLMAQANGYPAKLGNLSYDFNFNWKDVRSLLYNEAGKKIKKKTLKDCVFKDIAEICNMHSIGTWKIYHGEIDKENPSYLLDKKVLPIVLEMQRRGIRLDKELLAQRNREYKEKVYRLKERCLAMGFNPASPQSIGIALSKEGFITSFTPKGRMTTGEEALLPLVDQESPVAINTLFFRKEQKLYSTYIKPFYKLDRIYPKFHIVRTGRFAGTKPNPQNIPVDLRDQYLPEEGEFFWDADASQIEPRIMAWLSGDKKMQGDLATGDIYLPIAQRYNIARYTAKQLVLASSYGAGDRKLVETSHRHGDDISLSDAHNLLQGYYRDYAGFAKWKGEMESGAERDGYILTWMGRKRTLESMAEDEVDDYDPLLKVVNSIVQGTAAEILKLAMLRLQDYKISTTIHDELLLSVEEAPSPELLDNLCPIYLKWEIKVGKDWLHLTPLA